jgi:hypothetical protein
MAMLSVRALVNVGEAMSKSATLLMFSSMPWWRDYSYIEYAFLFLFFAISGIVDREGRFDDRWWNQEYWLMRQPRPTAICRSGSHLLWFSKWAF